MNEENRKQPLVDKVKLHWFAEKLELAGYSKRTIKGYLYDLGLFFRYVHGVENIATIAEIKAEHITAYHNHLHFGTFRDGNSLHVQTIRTRLEAVRRFFKLLYDEGHAQQDLSGVFILPRLKRANIPRNVPTVEQMNAFLDGVQPHTFDPITLRDRCMLELMYATALRAAETLQLTIADVNLTEQTLFVHGKGGKDRIVPLGAWVKPWLLEYLEMARPRLIDKRRPCDNLFVSKSGQPLSVSCLSGMVHKHLARMENPPRIWTHGIRHACATHMLAGGADIRYIQELLGHSELSSTQIYTRLDITQLKEAHRRCHPRDKE